MVCTMDAAVESIHVLLCVHSYYDTASTVLLSSPVNLTQKGGCTLKPMLPPHKCLATTSLSDWVEAQQV
jgi:hypothetical protein